MDAWLEEMKAMQERTYVNLREMKPEIRAHNEKFEVLQGCIVSRMDIHQARAEAMQEKTDAKLKEEIKASKEEMKGEMRAWRKEIKARREAMMGA
jgi:hypothetical protein